MKLSERDKRVIIVGGVACGAILLAAFVLIPLIRWWAGLGHELEPKLRSVETIRKRALARRQLLARRCVLVKRIGALFPEPRPGKKPSAKAAPKTKEPAPAKVPPKKAETPPTHKGPPQSQQKKGEQPNPSATKAEKSPPQRDGKKPGRANPAVEKRGKAPPATPTPRSGSGADAVGLAAQLERLAKKVGLQIKRIKARPSARGAKRYKHYRTIALQLSAEGNIQSLMKLLYEIEKGERFVRVERFRLRRDAKKGSKIEISAFDVIGYEPVARKP